MDLTTCSVCALAGSVGGVATGYCVGRRRRPRPTRVKRGIMRSWPGRVSKGDRNGPGRLRRGRKE